MASLRPALQWRLLLLWVAALLLPTLAATLPVWRMLSGAFDYSVQAAGLAERLDLVAVADLATLSMRHGSALSGGAIVAAALGLLLSPLLTGAAITAARAPQPPRMAQLLAGAMHEYGRLLRMLLWALLPLGLAGLAAGFALDLADGYALDARVPAEADRASMAAAAVAALLFALVHLTLDLGRAVLALDRRRRSAVRAWFDGLRLLARRPLASIGFYLGVSAAGLALAGLLGLARIHLPPIGPLAFAGAFLLTQLAVAVLAATRCARLFGLMHLARGPGSF
ncbi:hypothetical protein B0920_11040 [Massilia sp. KIM]|nr:hypothetical protein B0920_11040 [Massilia sp. KIM]